MTSLYSGRKSPSVLKSFRLFFIAIIFFGTSGVSEAACWSDALVRKDRDLLIMSSGTVYQLVDDPRLVAFWLPLTQVSICDQVDYVYGVYYEIRNKDDASTFVRTVRPQLWY